jgi:SpoVK/Ycf46/Vps4 family AAA+-type ATPase
LCVKEAVREAILSKPRDDSSTDSSSERTKVTVTLESIQRAIRKTKPSSIKSISVEIPSVPWSSIGGMSQVKQQLREAIEYPLKYGHVFKKMNIPPPKGILLYGPPGCSKTLMARALATEGHMNFLAVKGPELLSKWCTFILLKYWTVPQL